MKNTYTKDNVYSLWLDLNLDFVAVWVCVWRLAAWACVWWVEAWACVWWWRDSWDETECKDSVLLCNVLCCKGTIFCSVDTEEWADKIKSSLLHRSFCRNLFSRGSDFNAPVEENLIWVELVVFLLLTASKIIQF